MKKMTILAFLLLAALFLTACTIGVNQNNDNATNQTNDSGSGTDLGQDNQTTTGDMIRYSCTDSQRNADVCYEIYKPVCGWFNASKIQCIKYPCAQTFSNDCFACQNPNVAYYTEGECPTE